jgi:hypothetical protein
VRYEHCLWAHPPSRGNSGYYRFKLNRPFRELRATAGMKDGMDWPSKSELTFRLVGDGKLLWKSRPMKRSGDTQPVLVGISGVETLELYVDCPGDMSNAWAVWLDPLLKE